MNDRLIANLDAPLSNYLPDAGAQDGVITLRQLLAQRRAEHVARRVHRPAGAVLERVTSQPYPTLVAERLWKPLGAGTLEFRAGTAGGGRAA